MIKGDGIYSGDFPFPEPEGGIRKRLREREAQIVRWEAMDPRIADIEKRVAVLSALYAAGWRPFGDDRPNDGSVPPNALLLHGLATSSKFTRWSQYWRFFVPQALVHVGFLEDQISADELREMIARLEGAK
jgi:hypothetical protein